MSPLKQADTRSVMDTHTNGQTSDREMIPICQLAYAADTQKKKK